MSYSSTSAAATSSCVESGFDAQSTTSAPPALSVRIRLAVSVVTWRQAEMRYPSSGFSRSNRSRIACRTGICRSAQSMRRTPSGASARSFTSCRFVVAMNPSLWSRGSVVVACSGSGRLEQPFVLALLPFDPRAAVVAAREPGIDRAPQLRLAPEPTGERKLGQLEPEAPPELAQRAEPVQLGEAVLAVPRGRAPRQHQAVLLEVAQHPR